MESASRKVVIDWGASGLSKDAMLDADSGTWSVTFSKAELQQVGDGQASFTVTATDRAGNEAEVTSPNLVLELVNEAPVAEAGAIAADVVINAAENTQILDLTDLNGDGGSTTNDVAFTDVDGGANGTLTYTATAQGGGALPAWLEVTSAGIVKVKAGQSAPSAAGPVNLTITATDGGTPFKDASKDITIDVVAAPTVVSVIETAPEDLVVKGGDAAQLSVTFSDTLDLTGSTDGIKLKYRVGDGAEREATFVSHVTNTMVFNAIAPVGQNGSFVVTAIVFGTATVTGQATGIEPLVDNLSITMPDLVVDNILPVIDTTGPLEVEENAGADAVVATLTGTDASPLTWSFVAGANKYT
ncbi:MAG: putative Ig domain-containing protein, partial [Phycisphaerales bacterium]|nr:putative Ig domain-containing protein [Phycisphaerales bacterium]